MEAMKYIAVFLSLIIVSCGGEPEHRYTGHPIIGTWESVKKNYCKETFEFLPSGTRLVQSNEERVESKFEIAMTPNEYGAYQFTDEVTFDNGRPACSGSTADKTGSIVTAYAAFEKTTGNLYFCLEESLKKCIGPYVRAK